MRTRSLHCLALALLVIGAAHTSAEQVANEQVQNRGAGKDNWWDKLPRPEWSEFERVDQDQFALESHQKAVAAIEGGKFREEIVPVEVPGRKGKVTVIDTDEGLVVADAPAGWVELHQLPPADLVPGLGISGLSERFIDFLDEAFTDRPIRAVALTQACVTACDARKAIVDHYNRLCKQIERLDQKAAAMGVPEPGPRREEKQKLELAASDTRIARTQAMGRYDKCRQHMEHELVWFHEELARTMGAALKDLVVAQGASAGQAAHACAGHFEELRAMLRSAPAAFV